MRTETDLRDAFEARESMAPDPDSVLVGVTGAVGRHRHRRLVTVVAATIAVAAAISLPVMALRGDSDGAGTDPAGPPPLPSELADRPPFSFTVSAGTVAGYELTPYMAGPEVETHYLTSAAEQKRGPDLVVYGSDFDRGDPCDLRIPEYAWDAAEDPVPTEVAGAPAWFSTTASGTLPKCHVERTGSDESVLRWEYAPGAFAVLTSRGDPPMTGDALREVAEAVEFTTPYQATVAFQLDYLPAGMEPSEVKQEVGTWLEGQWRGGSSHLVLDGAGQLYISTRGGDSEPESGMQATTVAGYPAQCREPDDESPHLECLVEIDGLDVSIAYDGEDAAAELEKIVAGMTAATWEDSSTWYDLDDALP